jgi:cation:H+ antiporter
VSTGLAAGLFVVSLGATLYAAAVFADRLDHAGARLGLPEGLLGLLTAAGADAPELATAVAALATGSHDVGFGVVVGSNVFNLGAMIGLSALLCGTVRIKRDALAFEGGVALAVTSAMVLLAFGALPAWAALGIALGVVVPYGVVAFRRELEDPHVRPERVHEGKTLLLIPPALAVIVLGSVGMVHAGLKLGHAAGMPDVLIGTLVLAVVTSIPNAYTGVRLGLARRGSALVSETFNSNTINLVGGLAIPALFVTVNGGGLARADGVWLLVATALALVLLAPRGGMRRVGGALLVLSWVAFAVVQGVVGG